MKSEFAFILGNGVTRLQVDCKSLLDYGAVYGCNRIYQDFAPTVLVSTDKEMAHEIQLSGYSGNHIHYTRKQNKIKSSGANILPNLYHDMSSGPACLGLAAESNANYLFMIGMDLKGVNNKINNIYAGTINYKDADSAPTPFCNWTAQINTIMKNHQDKRFMHVNPINGFTDESFFNNTNFEIVSLDDFKQVINNL